MLLALTIDNLALVQSLNWEPGSGLNALTGETGAGKSMVIGALELVLGKRASQSLIRQGEDRCEVSALFQPSAALEKKLNTLLENAGIQAQPELLIRRQLRPSGSRQWLNDQPVTVSLLQQIGAELVDLHGPHDHQSLFSTSNQRYLLDAFGQHQALCEDCAHWWQQWQQAEQNYLNAQRESQASAAELELLQHRANEIAAADLKLGEDQHLEELHRRLRNASRLSESSTHAQQLLEADSGGLLNQLQELQKNLRELERLDPQVSDWLVDFESAQLSLSELHQSLANYASELHTDPAEQAQLEARFDLLETLKRKYGPTLEEVIQSGEAAQQALEQLENRDQNLAELQELSHRFAAELETSARKLSQARRATAPKLARAISAQLQELGLAKSQMQIELKSQDTISQHGREQIEFLFAANPGEALKPLRQVASSGEASRVMLALKTALSAQDPVALLVFDEIDANVGGEIAVDVGKKLAQLGQQRQVVAITHFPQVAALAQNHFVVKKQSQQGQTSTSLQTCSAQERINELARMLGGNSQAARSHAQELLKSSSSVSLPSS